MDGSLLLLGKILRMRIIIKMVKVTVALSCVQPLDDNDDQKARHRISLSIISLDVHKNRDKCLYLATELTIIHAFPFNIIITMPDIER